MSRKRRYNGIMWQLEEYIALDQRKGALVDRDGWGPLFYLLHPTQTQFTRKEARETEKYYRDIEKRIVRVVRMKREFLSM